MADGKSQLEPILSHFLAGFIGWILKPDPTPGKKLKREGVSYLEQVVSEWRPVNCQSEAECQLALQNYLQGRFSEDRLLVDREYGAGPNRMDLVVENRYAIELKYNLESKSDVDRLVGQASVIEQHFDGGLIVLCGESREEYVVRLQREVESAGDPDERVIRVVMVPIVVTRGAAFG